MKYRLHYEYMLPTSGGRVRCHKDFETEAEARAEAKDLGDKGYFCYKDLEVIGGEQA